MSVAVIQNFYGIVCQDTTPSYIVVQKIYQVLLKYCQELFVHLGIHCRVAVQECNAVSKIRKEALHPETFEFCG